MMGILSNSEISCCFAVLHHFTPWSYMSNSLVLLCVRAAARCCAPTFTNIFHLFFVFFPEEKESFLGEGDGMGNSCTIGSEIYLDVSYLHYLYDARLSVSSCIRACQVWSAPYDGENPPPEKYQPGILEEPGLKARQTQMALKRAPQPLAPPCPQPCPQPVTEPPSVNQLELEWDDSYDACPVQTQEAPVAIKPPQLPPAEPPKHIQEMRRTAIMLVKGSYIEESEFQDDVMVYDLVAKKDARDDDHGKNKLRRPEPEPQTVKNGLSLILPASGMADSGQNSFDMKARGQKDCNSNLPKTTPAELGDDLLAQYEELIRTLDTETDGKPVKAEGALKKPVTPVVEEDEEEDGMDFTSFSAETPEPEKLHSPFGTRLRSASANRSHSLPFTGKFMGKSIIFCYSIYQKLHLGCVIKRSFVIALSAGPFVSVLLSRLENMLSNSLHVNLLLTGILAQLAAYPQPLLRSFLLNTNLVFQPTVRSLYQVTKTCMI